MKKHGVYFLQKKGVLGWDTLEQSKSMAVLRSSLVREVEENNKGELRVVAGDFSDTTGTWAYRQIFYSDQDSVGITLGDEDGHPEAANDEAEDTSWPPVTARSRFEDDGGQDPIEDELDALINTDTAPSPDEIEQKLEGLIEESGSSERWSFYEEVEGEENDDGPVSISVGNDDDSSDNDDFDLGFAVPPELPKARKKRGGVLKFLLWFILVVFLAAVIAGAALVVLKHPIIMPYVEKFHLSETIDKLTAPVKALIGGEAKMDAQSQHGAGGIMPPVSGNAIKYVGIAPQLLGKWSPLKCDQTFIDFEPSGYVATVEKVAETHLNKVVETIEDEYHFYLRRSDKLIEHFQKLSPNDIQLAGTTTEQGFQQGTSQILSRCEP